MAMEMNQYELKALLEGEITAAQIWTNDKLHTDELRLQWGFAEVALLDWEGGDTFYIIDSDADGFFPGETISVDEILDIVLEAR